jgi:hypothetical protein
MQAVREHDRRIIACTGYRWPEVDKRTHPVKHQRPSVERRTGPRASRFNDLEEGS